jgi:hypothetical protein
LSGIVGAKGMTFLVTALAKMVRTRVFVDLADSVPENDEQTANSLHLIRRELFEIRNLLSLSSV